MKQSILADWNPQFSKQFGEQTTLFHHRLRESGLFERAALAKLIDKTPQEHYGLNTMGRDPQNPVWRSGLIGENGGETVIDTIEKGRMWLNIQRIQDYAPEYAELLDDLYADFNREMPDFKPFKTSLGVLISSPEVQVFYHADVPGQSLWQLHGEKQVYIYPNREPFLPQKALEGIIMGDTEEEIKYDPSFDNHADKFLLKSGEALNWGLNGPHRVVNENCLNISATTEHWTADVRNSYAVNYANGVLRKKFGATSLSQKSDGLSVYPKAALALAWKKLNLNKADEFVRVPTFWLDPKGEDGMSPMDDAVKKSA